MVSRFTSGLATAQSSNNGFSFNMEKADVDRDNEEASYNATCDLANSQEFSAIVDLTWGGWDDMKMQAEKNGMPYIRLEAANHQFVKVQT